MTKPIDNELIALLRVQRDCTTLAETCGAISATVAAGGERETWDLSETQVWRVAGLIDFSMRDSRRRAYTAFEIVEGMPVHWIQRALDSVGTLRGIAFLHEALHGEGVTLRRLGSDLRAAHNSLLTLDDLHRRHALARAGADAVECAETEAMILRAVRRIIRRRARSATFDIGFADVPSYSIDTGTGVHRIRVTPRWRDVVRRLGTATPKDHFVLLDAEPPARGSAWWVTCAWADINREVEVHRLRWDRPDLFAAPAAIAA